MDESNPNPAAFSELRSVTDLALRATKITAQAIGRSMAHLLVLELHLWLNLTETKDADKVPFLECPVSPTGLFGPAVEDIAEHFRATQKSPQAMRHFLPKRSSCAAAATQQPVKATPPAELLKLGQMPPTETPGTPAQDSDPIALSVFLIDGTGRGKG